MATTRIALRGCRERPLSAGMNINYVRQIEGNNEVDGSKTFLQMFHFTCNHSLMCIKVRYLTAH